MTKHVLFKTVFLFLLLLTYIKGVLEGMAESSQLSPLNAFLKPPGPNIWFRLLLSLLPMQNMENMFSLCTSNGMKKEILKPLIL